MLATDAERLHRHAEVLVLFVAIHSGWLSCAGKLAIHRVELLKIVATKLFQLWVFLHLLDLHQVLTDSVNILPIQPRLL